MIHLLAVAAGGAIGASLRHLVNLAVLRNFGPGLPLATVLVNVVGCFAMGVLIEFLARRASLPVELKLFLATGLLGGFTTFSAFALDFAVLLERGALAQAFFYATTSVVLSLAGLFLGLWLARSLA